MDNEKINRFLSITDSSLKSEILATLWTRISGGLELGENQPAELGMKNPSDAWNKASEYLISLADKDPGEAFKLGITLVGIPKNSDSQKESVNKWMRTNGLLLLGLDQMRVLLLNYFDSNSDSEKLADMLRNCMETDISDLTSSHDFDGNPTGYSTVQSVYICLGLGDKGGDVSSDLYKQSLKRASDPDIKMAYGVLSSFPDCAYLKDRFL